MSLVDCNINWFHLTANELLGLVAAACFGPEPIGHIKRMAMDEPANDTSHPV